MPEGCKYAGPHTHALIGAVQDEADVQVIALIRGDERQRMPSTYEVLREGDILLVEADSDSLKALLDVTGVELAADVEEQENKAHDEQEAAEQAVEQEKAEKNHKSRHGELTLAEAIVSPGSSAGGHQRQRPRPARAPRRQRAGRGPPGSACASARAIRFAAGDILLLQAREDALQSSLNSLGCLPLASRGLSITTPRNVILASAIFAITPGQHRLRPAAGRHRTGYRRAGDDLVGLIPLGRIYESIDMPVIVLVAAMLPVGRAETTGGSQLIADALLELGQSLPAAATLALLMVAVMLISNVVNNAAAAVLAAPVAISLARGMDASVDPFLMAVAIGASCAFLTPIGHQSNTTVMAPGGYRFGDYWRLGLPLSILVVLCAVPAILWIWPL